MYKTILVATDMLKDFSIDPKTPLQFSLDQIKLVSPHSLIYKRVKQHAGPVGGPVREGPALDSYIFKMQ